MWPKSYKDYKVDQDMIKYPVEPSHGIIGCEMHEINGWGNQLHIPHKKKPGLIRTLIHSLFRPFKKVI